MRCLSNSEIPGFTAKEAEIASPEYIQRVARPVMDAIDRMPRAYREVVNEFGYVDVYRAWKRGISPSEIAQRSRDGGFHLD